MNVRTLIEHLSKLDPELMVVVSGYEGGVDEVDLLEPVKLKLNVNTKWYYGKHEEDKDGETQAIKIG